MRRKHPCDGMSEGAISLFERIAINMSPKRSDASALSELLKHGLVLLDRYGSYYVPIHTHYQWCDYCSQSLRKQLKAEREAKHKRMAERIAHRNDRAAHE